MTNSMRINGLKVDAQAIGNGFYEIICEQGEEAIVAFGMIPYWIIQMAEKMIREKVIALAAAQLKVSVEDFKPYVDEKLVKETVQPIIHEITLSIFTAAKNKGMLVV